MARKVAMEAAVVVTRLRPVLLALLALAATSVRAAVLPEDRADALYHRYDGGGVTIDGPSILIRKGDDKSFSVSGNYYVDNISSASIDVVTQGSKYDEKRTQYSGTLDYLHADTIMSAGYTDSDEDDYKAKTATFNISQSMFGDLTTVALGYSRGWDDVFRNGDPDFKDSADRESYRVSLTQVLTKDAISSINYEAVTDEGFLNNPYRSVRYVDDTVPLGYSFQPEVYPRTRTSNAASVNLLYFLPYRASVKAGYRYFNDDWDITAHTFELGYTHPLGKRWTLEAGYRFYTQDSADFYSDLFPFKDATNFRARDKELSKFHDNTLNLGVSYLFLDHSWKYLERASFSFKYSRIWFNYDDYRDIRKSAPVGDEPEYDFAANVIRAYVSVFY